MADAVTIPTKVDVDEFLLGITERRRDEAHRLIALMREISGLEPVMWGPSIIGFGSQHYRYDTGREGDMPILGFSPRKAQLTLYFDGWDHYSDLLPRLGKHKLGVSCLYVNKLDDVDRAVLREMLEQCHARGVAASAAALTPAAGVAVAPATDPVAAYLAAVPPESLDKLDELRALASAAIPDAVETISYGIIGYRIGRKRAKAFVSGWRDHVAVYPLPADDALQAELAPYQRGKGTLWFPLDAPLPRDLLTRTFEALARS